MTSGAVPLHVLIVDDEPSLTVLLSRILGAAGFVCEAAGSVEQAQARLASGGFDVLLSDVRLSDGSGFDLVQTAVERRPELAAQLVSGLDESLLRERARGIGAGGVITKPFTPADVLAAVAGALAATRPGRGAG